METMEQNVSGMLEKIFKKLDDIQEKHSETRETMLVMVNRVEDMSKAVNGNGKPGVIDDLKTVKTAIEEHKKDDERFRWKVLLAGVIFLSGSGAGGAFLLEKVITLAKLWKGIP